MNIPIACTLTPAELHERRQTVLASIRNSALEIMPTSDGCVWRFSPGGDILARLATLVELERQCCAFLTFRIVVEPQQPIALEITGPSEVQPVIANLFG